jgi:hypothetical protein
MAWIIADELFDDKVRGKAGEKYFGQEQEKR